MSDLDGQLFFNFSDLKPGDWGEDTVSLHVYSNDAWACITFENMVDYDNDCTEPEAEDGDTSCGDPGPGEGELSEYLYFFFWADVCARLGFAGLPELAALPGDNIYQPYCDIPLMEGYADEILPGQTYTLAAPGEVNVFTGVTDEPLIGSHDYYIGKAWCFGDLTIEEKEIAPGAYVGEIKCDGEPVGNITQTDSLEADITFYAEQSRNNNEFTCGEVCETSGLYVDDNPPTIDGTISSGEYPEKYAELNTVKTGVCPDDAYTGTVGRFYFAYDDNGVYIAIESLDAGIWGSSIGFWGDLDNGVGYSESYPGDITNAGGQFAGTSMVHEYYLPYNAADSSGLGNGLEWYAQFVNAADGVSVFNLRESGTCFAALDYYKGTYTLPGPTWTTTSYDQDGWTRVELCQ